MTAPVCTVDDPLAGVSAPAGDPASVRAAAAVYTAAAGVLQSQAATLRGEQARITGPAWSGPAAQAATARLHRETAVLDRAVTTCQTAASVLATYAAALEHAHQGYTQAQRLATAAIQEETAYQHAHVQMAPAGAPITPIPPYTSPLRGLASSTAHTALTQLAATAAATAQQLHALTDSIPDPDALAKAIRTGYDLADQWLLTPTFGAADFIRKHGDGLHDAFRRQSERTTNLREAWKANRTDPAAREAFVAARAEKDELRQAARLVSANADSPALSAIRGAGKAMGIAGPVISLGLGLASGEDPSRVVGDTAIGVAAGSAASYGVGALVGSGSLLLGASTVIPVWGELVIGAAVVGVVGYGVNQLLENTAVGHAISDGAASVVHGAGELAKGAGHALSRGWHAVFG